MTNAPPSPVADANHAKRECAKTPGLAYCFAGVAFAITWLATLWRLSPSTAWEGDYAAAQRLGAGVIGYEGLVSQALSQVFLALPIGTAVQRISLPNALGAAFSAWFAYLLAHRVLCIGTQRQTFVCWLALGASLFVCLGNTVQSVAPVAAGPCVAVALGLACVLSMLRVFAGASGAQSELSAAIAAKAAGLPCADQTRQSEFFLLGMGVAITALESHVVGLICIGMVLALWRSSAQPQLGRLPLWTLAGFVAVGAFIGAPCFVARRFLEAASVERPVLDSLARLQPFSSLAARQSAWLVQLGPIWSCISGLGILLLVQRCGQRRECRWVFALLAASAFLLPPASESGRAEEGGPVILGTVALAVAGSMACRAGVDWVTRRRPNAFALLATLTVLAQTVTVLARNEEVHFGADHYRGLSDEAWADEALAGLPARALVLTKTNAITNRLIVAQQLEGARPDVLVVPVDRLTEPRMLRLLLGVEPALAPTLRDFAINGKPSENALAGLSDVRPLFIEFDGTWDARLREHLLVMPIFHRVYSQTLGRSDRAVAIPEGQRTVTRLLALTPSAADSRSTYGRNPGDAVTRSIVEARLREQLILLLALGDRQGFETVAADYEQAFPGSPWLGQVRRRVSASTRGAVIAFDLLGTVRE